jgi:hypothetical protein
MAQATPAEVLDRVLQNSGADGFDLPPLLIQKEQTPDWLERFYRWLNSLFDTSGKNGAVGDIFVIFLKAILVLGVVLFVVALVSIVFSAFRKAANRARDAQFALKRGSGEQAPREKLQTLLEDALRGGRTGEAARLRWKLHLMRASLPSSITPGETEGFGRFYPLMFGDAGAAGNEGALRLYNELDLSLRSREGAP